KAAGLECGFIDPLPFAASRAIQAIVQSQKQPLDLTKEDVLVIYLDLEQVQMMLFAKAVPMLGRSIYLADSPNRGSFVLERRKLDLKATFDFVKRQLGLDTLKRIILLGPSILDDESLKNWASGISEELGLKVDIIKPIGAAVASVSDRTWAGSPTPPAGAGHLSVPEALRSGAAVQEKDKQAGALLELADWSEMAAFGAALQGEPAGTASFELNLARSAVGAAPKQKAVKKIWAAVAAAGVVFLGFGFWRSHRAGEMARKAQAVSAKAEEGMPEIKGKNQASLKEMTDSLTGSLGVIRLCGSPDHRIYATYILSALADFAPKEAWLEKVNYAVSGIGTNFGLGAQPTVTLDIAGKVEISQDQPETAAIQEFFKRLKNDPRFSRNFPSGNVAFQKEQRPDAPHQGDLRDAGTLMAFTMNFKNEGK
ncbi:MAG: hypothetical protein HY747_08605, partial [Elusimicrobia bacterium]|nr:hypothetical protein [Elusimicrobiota bacterium]